MHRAFIIRPFGKKKDRAGRGDRLRSRSGRAHRIEALKAVGLRRRDDRRDRRGRQYP